MTPIHDDVNRRDRTHRITEKPVVIEDSVRHCPSDALVAARCWEDLNLVNDFFDPLHSLYAALRYTFQKGVANITQKGYIGAVDSKRQMVKDGKLRNRNKFISHFL